MSVSFSLRPPAADGSIHASFNPTKVMQSTTKSSTSIARLAALIDAGNRVLLVGAPGLAKTARINAVGKLLGIPVFYGVGGRTCDLMDRLDASGAVVPDVAAGVSRTLPLEALQQVLTHKGRAIWFLDEIGRAPLDVQGGLCSQLDALKAAGSEVIVVAATNRPQDRAGVAALSEQLRSRFDQTFFIATPDNTGDKAEGAIALCSWADEVTGWCDYAADAGFDPVIVAWHRSTSGSTLYNWRPTADASLRFADYRSWHSVAKLFRAGLTETDLVAATVGREIAVKFSAFAAMARELPLPSAVLADPANAPVPSSPAACFFLATVLPTAVTSTKAVAPFLTYIDRLPRIYTALAARDLHRKHGAGPLARSAEWNAWFIQNQALFA